MTDSPVDLSVQVGPLTWPTPVGLASGTCGYGSELEGLVDWSAVGAIFTKGLSLQPRSGNAPPRIWETESGMLNAIGLENVGVEAFATDKMPFLRRWKSQHGGVVIANLFATSVEEYAALARRLDDVDGVDGVEINLSCPNVSAGGIEFGRTGVGCARVTEAVRQATGKFVCVKLTPASDVVEVARASEDAGADAVSIANTMPAMAIDVNRKVPRLSRGSGGLSGPALRPIVVRMTFEAARVVQIPIIGIGGIMEADHALEFLLAGAMAVQVGTATFADPNAAGKICDGLRNYLVNNQHATVSDVAGALRPSEHWSG